MPKGSMWFRDVLGGSTRFFSVPCVLQRYHEVQKGTTRFLDVPAGSMTFHEVPWGAMRCHEVPWVSISFDKVPQGCTIRSNKVLHGSPRSSFGSCQVLSASSNLCKVVQGFHEVQSGSVRLQKVLWGSMRFYKVQYGSPRLYLAP